MKYLLCFLAFTTSPFCMEREINPQKALFQKVDHSFQSLSKPPAEKLKDVFLRAENHFIEEVSEMNLGIKSLEKGIRNKFQYLGQAMIKGPIVLTDIHSWIRIYEAAFHKELHSFMGGNSSTQYQDIQNLFDTFEYFSTRAIRGLLQSKDMFAEEQHGVLILRGRENSIKEYLIAFPENNRYRPHVITIADEKSLVQTSQFYTMKTIDENKSYFLTTYLHPITGVGILPPSGVVLLDHPKDSGKMLLSYLQEDDFSTSSYFLIDKKTGIDQFRTNIATFIPLDYSSTQQARINFLITAIGLKNNPYGILDLLGDDVFYTYMGKISGSFKTRYPLYHRFKEALEKKIMTLEGVSREITDHFKKFPILSCIETHFDLLTREWKEKNFSLLSSSTDLILLKSQESVKDFPEDLLEDTLLTSLPIDSSLKSRGLFPQSVSVEPIQDTFTPPSFTSPPSIGKKGQKSFGKKTKADPLSSSANVSLVKKEDKESPLASFLETKKQELEGGKWVKKQEMDRLIKDLDKHIELAGGTVLINGSHINVHLGNGGATTVKPHGPKGNQTRAKNVTGFLTKLLESVKGKKG